jgi:broad specificity phosphatase PhoE
VSALVLVKHSAPLVVPDAAPATWRLSPEGVARCAPLTERLRAFRPRSIVSSVEAKAAETASLVAAGLGLSVDLVPGLHEHDRRDTAFLGSIAFADAVRELFARPDELVLGRETATQAGTRFAAAVDAILRDRPDEDVVVVSHGTVISLFVAARARADGYALWTRLGLPSLVVLGRPELGLDAVEVDVTG